MKLIQFKINCVKTKENQEISEEKTSIVLHKKSNEI